MPEEKKDHLAKIDKLAKSILAEEEALVRFKRSNISVLHIGAYANANLGSLNHRDNCLFFTDNRKPTVCSNQPAHHKK